MSNTYPKANTTVVDGHTLSTRVRKLRQRSMKQLPLLPKRLLLLINMSRRDLERHILIRDLGDIRDEEYARETEDENADG